MDAKQRRAQLLAMLTTADKPQTGTWLAKELNVSRQVIVGDFAILRAAGNAVYATPQGYILPKMEASKTIKATIACKHEGLQLEQELGIIIDYGGKVLDVAVEHPLYGELTANLMIASRYDLENFLQKLTASAAEQLSTLTGGVHLHTIEVPDLDTLSKIEEALRKEGILLK